jgi:hypothetical protein
MHQPGAGFACCGQCAVTIRFSGESLRQEGGMPLMDDRESGSDARHEDIRIQNDSHRSPRTVRTARAMSDTCSPTSRVTAGDCRSEPYSSGLNDVPTCGCAPGVAARCGVKEARNRQSGSRRVGGYRRRCRTVRARPVGRVRVMTPGVPRPSTSLGTTLSLSKGRVQAPCEGPNRLGAGARTAPTS